MRPGRESSLRYALVIQVLLVSSLAFGGDEPASCELIGKSVVSRSSAGLAQVSNLGDIEIECRMPARPFPTDPAESRFGLRTATTAYKISPDGSRIDGQLRGDERRNKASQAATRSHGTKARAAVALSYWLSLASLTISGQRLG
jgi:hypothetical protein